MATNEFDSTNAIGNNELLWIINQQLTFPRKSVLRTRTTRNSTNNDKGFSTQQNLFLRSRCYNNKSKTNPTCNPKKKVRMDRTNINIQQRNCKGSTAVQPLELPPSQTLKNILAHRNNRWTESRSILMERCNKNSSEQSPMEFIN